MTTALEAQADQLLMYSCEVERLEHSLTYIAGAVVSTAADGDTSISAFVSPVANYKTASDQHATAKTVYTWHSKEGTEMKTDEETRAFVRKFINNVRHCMKDHDINIGELATLTGRSPHKLRLQFINKNLDLGVCAELRYRTGDLRALGLPADHELSGTLDEAVKLAIVTA